MILAVGLPVYFAQGVDRGVLQGQTRFGLLSLSYQAEMWARLLLAVLLVALGGTVNGAVAVIGGVAQVAALCLFHGSLQQVVLVQIYLMAGLLALLLLWDTALVFRARR